MTINGIGVDIVSVERIEKALARHADSFVKKILTPGEIDEYNAIKYKAAFVAKRFAAKEAVLKALGTGMSNGISFKDIAITHDTNGRPLVQMSDVSERQLELENAQVLISISDEDRYAMAYAMVVVN